MGGIGSGRKAGFGRPKVESRRAIDVNRLNREGCLSPGWSGLWRWSRDGETVASIGLKAENALLRLTYRVREGGNDWEDIDYGVMIDRTSCNYGGSRPWFICPGVVRGTPCGRRAGKLHSVGRWFLCRRCGDLRYTSQSETCLDRRLRRANMLRMRLGGEPGWDALVAPRPKGMHRRRYERMVEEILDIDAEVDAAMSPILRVLSEDDVSRNGERSFWT